MANFSTLPPELCNDIVGYALIAHRRPHEVLAVHSAFYHIGSAILYKDLRFRTVRQILRFSQLESPVPHLPRNIELTLSGGTDDFHVFQYLANAIDRCRKSFRAGHLHGTHPDALDKAPAALELDTVSLCLNSHSSNPRLYQIYTALTRVNPRRFSWIGPDPSHHFSIAIVPAAILYLFSAMAEWSRVEHVVLSNIAFPSDIALPFPNETDSDIRGPPLVPRLPELRTLYIGQAAGLHPWIIAAMVFLPGQDKLEQVRVVDAYKSSIWEPRLRRKDILNAALASQPDLSPEIVEEQVKRLVSCEAKTERIIGGDRAEGISVLE